MELDLSLGDVLTTQKNKHTATQKPDFFGVYFHDRASEDEAPLQLSLHPLGPPNSYENGSSGNGSSGNRRAPEDTLSANSVGSSLKMGFGLLKPAGNGNSQIGSDDGAAVDAAERASDEEDNAVNTRKKHRLSKEQFAFLEGSFKEHNTLNPKQKMAIAKQLNLRPRQVEVWFQNRRARTKLKQTEMDCEYLKRCYDALTEENRRLHKEVQELRALKSASPFYMQIPATTLTMCPSCERISGSAAAAAPPEEGKFGSTRPRIFPFQKTTSHPHQSAAS